MYLTVHFNKDPEQHVMWPTQACCVLLVYHIQASCSPGNTHTAILSPLDGKVFKQLPHPQL